MVKKFTMMCMLLSLAGFLHLLLHTLQLEMDRSSTSSGIIATAIGLLHWLPPARSTGACAPYHEACQ